LGARSARSGSRGRCYMRCSHTKNSSLCLTPLASYLLSFFALPWSFPLVTLRQWQRLTWFQQLQKATWRPCRTAFQKRPTLILNGCVAFLLTMLYRVFCFTCIIIFFIEKEHFEGCQLQRDCLSFSYFFSGTSCFLSEVERITHACA